jgi:hypothetical protein
MCNPDGVIVGNHRTTLIGRDMNRQYSGLNNGGANFNDEEKNEDEE